MGAKDPGLVFENSKNAFLHKMVGYICIDSSQGIIKEVKLFLLRGRQKRRIQVLALPQQAVLRRKVQVPLYGTSPAPLGQHDVV